MGSQISPTSMGLHTNHHYGEKEVYVVSNCKMLEDLCDKIRFSTITPDTLTKVSGQVPSGLFTARTEDPDWGQA